MKHRASLALTLLASGFAGASSALSVSVTDDAAALAAGLALDGVTLVGTPTLTAPQGAAGLFSGGAADGLAFDSGVLLSTGLAADAVGPNDFPDVGDGNGGPGTDLFDPFLSVSTFDAAVFEVDFVLDPGFTGASLDYLFASDEFPEFTGEGLDDTVIVFIDGVNVAGTSSGTPFFIDNSGTVDDAGLIVPGSAPLDIEYDGISVPLSAAAPNLGVDSGVHTLTVVLADVGDEFVDSAVFLSRLSGTAIPTPSAAAAGLALLVLGAARRRRFTA